MAPKRSPPTALRIHTPAYNPLIVLAADNPASPSAPSSSASDSASNSHKKPKSLRNMKNLSINLPSAQSSSNSLLQLSPPQSAIDTQQQDLYKSRPRRPSVLSLPNTAITTVFHRPDEDGSPTVPYASGPIQILPGIYLGSQDNARDWSGLLERRIKAILNVAQEVTSPFDSAPAQPLRPFASTPNLSSKAKQSNSTFYPPHIPSGRPAMHYLKLPWSHGQADLVQEGFPIAMAFVDAALERHEAILIHCQCGISRSATLVIALVMRAAAMCLPNVPPEVWQLKSMQAAYSFVKEKSKHVGPNMSLIYQLLEYEKALKGGGPSPAESVTSSSISEEEKEWGRLRNAYGNDEMDDRDDVMQQEAKDLDRAMEERIIARKHSGSSVASLASSSGVGMGPAWRSRYGRKRTGSVASILTTGSVLSEDLVEADEEQELLGVGGGFDEATEPRRSPCLSLSSESPTATELSAQPPSCKALSHHPPLRSKSLDPVPPTPMKLSFNVHPPLTTAFQPTSNFPAGKGKRRPPPLGILPPVPPSPVTPIAVQDNPETPRIRRRTPARKPTPPPLKLQRNTQFTFPQNTVSPPLMTAIPSQTLFVFPPSPSHVVSAMRTPSAMTVTSNVQSATYPFPSQRTPRVSTSRSQGRTRSFIGIGTSVAPTTAYSRVDARGWVGIE